MWGILGSQISKKISPIWKFLNLTDLGYIGACFTWWNKQEGEEVQSKQDSTRHAPQKIG